MMATYYLLPSMNMIVSLVLLLAGMISARAPNSSLLDTYDYIGRFSCRIENMSTLLTVVQLSVVDQQG